MAKSRQSSEVYIMRPCRVSTCPIISLSRHTQCMSTCGVLITISADHRGPSFPPPLHDALISVRLSLYAAARHPHLTHHRSGIVSARRATLCRSQALALAGCDPRQTG